MSQLSNSLSNPQRTARLAGAFYLVVAVAAGWSQLVVRAGLNTDGSPRADCAEHPRLR